MTPRVSIVIGTLNRHWYLKRTIESVRAEMSPPESEIVVVDGGSTDGTIRWLTKQKDVISIVQHNHGEWRGQPLPRRSWGYFMNLGFKAASAPVVCMLSDDALVVPGAIRNGLELLERDPDDKVGAVAFYWRNWPEQQLYTAGLTFGGRMFVNHGLFARKALEDVNFVDEESFGFYHADGDLALRFDARGWRCIDSPDSYIEHYSHANLDLRGQNTATQRQDWETYRERWGHLGDPERDWVTREHEDKSGTAVRYWGRQKSRESMFDRGLSKIKRAVR